MTDQPDIEALRRAYVAEVTAVRRAQPKPRTDRQVAASLSPDMSQEDLEAILVEADTFEAAMTLLLDILGDPSASKDLRMTALERLGAATFQPVRFAPFHAEYIDKLRALAVTDDPELRHMALDRL